MNLGLVAYKLSFELSPIILTHGVAKNMPGGMLPIIAITEALNFVDGLLSGGDPINLDNFFAHFLPVTGAKHISQQVGTYPFANQAVAANAVISQPLSVSMRMICPVRESLGYAVKLATMMNLQATLAQHNASGGTYTVATPTRFYTECLMTDMYDVTSGESNQLQTMWQMDFTQPLLTEQQAQEAENSLISKITNGTPIDGQPSWSGVASTIGYVNTLGATSLIPSASSTGAAGVAGVLGQ
jgi:hypothetical protein